jgi:Ca2+/Na+ antiporter
MKNTFATMLNVVAPSLLILGDLGLFFDKTMFAGYILFILGCAFGLIGVALSSKFESYERFNLLTSLMGFAIIALFVFTGILERVIIVALVLFVVNFVLMVVSLKKDAPVKQDEKYKKFNEKRLYNELDNIKEELGQVKIFEEGNVSDIEDLSLRNKAKQIKNDLAQAIVLEDPKEGRYFYKETGKMFHLKDCVSLQRANKKEIKASNSRTELLAKGYKSCKLCNS